MTSCGRTRHLTLWSLFHVAGLLELLPSLNVATDFATEVESCFIRKRQHFEKLMGVCDYLSDLLTEEIQSCMVVLL